MPKKLDHCVDAGVTSDPAIRQPRQGDLLSKTITKAFGTQVRGEGGTPGTACSQTKASDFANHDLAAQGGFDQRTWSSPWAFTRPSKSSTFFTTPPSPSSASSLLPATSSCAFSRAAWLLTAESMRSRRCACRGSFLVSMCQGKEKNCRLQICHEGVNWTAGKREESVNQKLIPQGRCWQSRWAEQPALLLRRPRDQGLGF